MSALSYIDRFIKTRKDPIHFIRTKDGNDRDCFYFLLADKRRIDAFVKSTPECSNLNDFGIIIASGWGHEPSTEVIELLKEKYEFDFDSLK